MAKNTNLSKAKKEKNDEFYTQMNDVAEELRHYNEHFKNKVVLCNCNDNEWSAFWQYFHLKFKLLGLKKLIATTYNEEGLAYNRKRDTKFSFFRFRECTSYSEVMRRSCCA